VGDIPVGEELVEIWSKDEEFFETISKWHNDLYRRKSFWVNYKGHVYLVILLSSGDEMSLVLKSEIHDSLSLK